jgi:hypothetical protein
MSRHAAIVEEFDDDTDLPLPSRSLPNTGSRGAILEEIANSDDDDRGGESDDEAPELLDPSAVGGPALQPSVRDTRVTDITPFKKCAQKLALILKRDRPHCPAHLSSSLGGRVFIRFTLMRSDRTQQVLGGSHGPRACGGLSARILRMPALAWG